MQTDLRLLLLIIGLVFGGYVLFNAFKNKRLKGFERKVIERELNGEEEDPLLEHYEGQARACEFEKAVQIIYEENEPINSPLATEQPAFQEFLVFSILPKSNENFAGHLLLSSLRSELFY